jgi:hypothetical protein
LTARQRPSAPRRNYPPRSFGTILHDPPRFGIAGELYAFDVYGQFARSAVAARQTVPLRGHTRIV